MKSFSLCPAIHFSSRIVALTFAASIIAGPFCGDVVAQEAAVTTAAPDQSTLLTEAQLADGWISLFDGETLYGWKPTSDANFRVEEGTIVVDDGKAGFLRTTSQFSDYELHVEFSAPATTNSGVFLRTPPTPKNVAKDCYEVNIAPDDNDFPTAGIVKRIKAQAKGLGAGNKWQKFDIKAEGNKITVQLNGQVVTEYTDEAPVGRGYICLQFRKGKIAFRNVRLRPLGMKSLFNGTDLTHWKEYPDMDSRFSVKEEDGEPVLHVANGRGQLETTESFGDFVLQLECKTHAASLNSGIFFRCIPGDTMMGYESQIQNGFKDGDRSKPEDCGTGGIFRRQDARRVVADDKKWFHKTLIVEGPHVAAWVNGYQVSDWSDTRKPHENPRKGLRLEAGTLMIQGHDPTTDISFRNLQANEMTVRRP